MIATIACLTFMHAAGASLSLPPPNVQELLKKRIAHQWIQRESLGSSVLRFDDNECSNKGSYHYTDRSIVLSADSDSWRGPLELPLTGVLEGELLPFERVAQNMKPKPHLPFGRSAADSKSSNQWKKWAPWTLAIVGAAVGAYMIVDRERHIRQLQGLSVSF